MAAFNESRVASFSSDIAYNNTRTNGGQSDRESASNGFGFSMVSGTGVSAAPGNFFDSYAKYTGVIQSGDTIQLNFSGLTHELIDDTTESRVFSHINGFTFANNGTGSGDVLLVRATGTDAFTNILNGESGNLKINPYGTFQAIDYYGSTKVTGSNRLLHIVNTGSVTGISYSYMAVGYTGATS
jgi:hypothetical protein